MISKKNSLGTNVITQIALVVNDINATAENYANFFGVSKPSIVETEAAEKTHITYRGKPTDARAKLAFFRFKNIVIELIEPDKSPSIWREYLDTYGEGFHHIAFNVKNGKERFATLHQQNMEVVQQGEFPGGRYSYVDAKNPLKLLLELLE